MVYRLPPQFVTNWLQALPAKLQFKTVNFSKILILGVAVGEVLWYNAIEYIMGEI